jgi:hypothetical protein
MAEESADTQSMLVTADFDFKLDSSGVMKIEFLPVN